MKKNIFTFVFALFLGFGFAQAQSVENLLNDYYSLKDALVASDGKQAAEAADRMLVSFKAIDETKFNDEQAKTFNSIKSYLKMDIEHISETQDVKHQRDHFTTLSERMITLVKVVDTNEDVYHQYCPMANKNKGGEWLSAQKEIRNPYYGSMMLKCGRVKETL